MRKKKRLEDNYLNPVRPFSQAKGRSNGVKLIYLLLAVIAIETVFLVSSREKRTRTDSLLIRQAVKEEKKAKKVIPKKQPSSKIAIVLDDWGYNLKNLGALKQIKEPLTLAILPRRGFSLAVAKAVQELNQEAILHLPLEPRQGRDGRLEPETILVGMDKPEALKILDADIKSVPGIKGVSNHMGSRATENAALMGIILAELKRRGLYFLDSLTGKTVCKGLAEKMGLPYERRQVFLDNKSDEKYILSQFELLAKIAKQRGSAIGIGHDRPKTLEVLVKAIPEFKKRGFQFVFVSELVQ
jgi:polysaccharide deacetylase 2 family uncharacterized protein YibQ